MAPLMCHCKTKFSTVYPTIFTFSKQSFNESLSPRFFKKASPRFFKKALEILQSPPCVTLSPPKPLDEIQPNLVCELLTWKGCATAHFFFLPRPLRQRFLKQTLCVFSQMKDIKLIRRDFHSVAWFMPQGSDLGGTVGGLSGQNIFFRKFNQIWCVGYLHQWHMQRHNFFVPTPWGPGEGPKGQISLNLNHKVNFKDF